MNVTKDLTKFGNIELAAAGKLLLAYADNQNGIKYHFYDGVQVCFNTVSRCVFLSDEDCNVAMMNGEQIEPWYTCPYCGHEGFFEDMIHEPEDEDCIEYMDEIGIDEDDIPELWDEDDD